MGNTANNNWPYPESTDLVKDGATAIENLADAIDTTLGVFVPSSPGLTLINTTSFSAVASQSISNVFSSTYTNYRILINVDDFASDNYAVMRLRTASDDTGSNYSYNVAGQAADNQNVVSAAQTQWVLSSYNTTGYASISLDLFNPNKAQNTVFNSLYTINNGLTTASGVATTNTQYTGFTIFSFVNFDGNVSVYGYNK